MHVQAGDLWRHRLQDRSRSSWASGRRARARRPVSRSTPTIADDERGDDQRSRARRDPSPGLRPAHRVDEVLAGPRHARPDRADRDAARLRRLRVGAPDHLGEHERDALVVGRARRRAPRPRGRRSGRPCSRRRGGVARCSSRPASRRRRTVRRTGSAQARRAIESSQVRALESPRNAGSAFQARTNVSWVTSSASSAPTRWQARRHTSAWLARMAWRSEVRSPSRAARNSRVSSSTATDDTGGNPSILSGDYLV